MPGQKSFIGNKFPGVYTDKYGACYTVVRIIRILYIPGFSDVWRSPHVFLLHPCYPYVWPVVCNNDSIVCNIDSIVCNNASSV